MASRMRWQERDGRHELVFEARVVAIVEPGRITAPWVWRASELRRAVTLGASHHGDCESAADGKAAVARVLRNASIRRARHG